MLKHFEEIIGASCLGVMVTIAFLNVCTRYFFKYSMAFTEELTLYLFVWVVMMGASIAFREGTNMAVSFFYDRFGSKFKRVFSILAALLSLAFFLTLMYFGIIEVMDEMEMNAMTEAIQIPIWWFTGAMPVASMFIMYRIVVHTADELQSKAKDF